MQCSRKQQGFTLIELSVVIVIIGLLITGVMAGRHLVQQASIRQAVVMTKATVNATSQFLSKYHYLPGDMPTATTHLTAAFIVNGNGNEFIEQAEASQALAQLSQAGFISGDYQGGTQYVAEVGDYTQLGIIGQIAHFDRINVNTLTLAHIKPETPHCFWCNGVFTVQEAKTIDGKIDDGVANTGVLYGVDSDDSSASNCSATWPTVAGLDYNANPPFPDKKICRMFYYIYNN